MLAPELAPNEYSTPKTQSIHAENFVEQNHEKSLDTRTHRENENNEKTYPEGGLQAWLVVFGSACCMISSFGYMNTLAIFQNYLSETLEGVSLDTIGWIFGLYTFLTFGGGIVVRFAW